MSEEDKVFAEGVEPGDNSRRDFLKKSLAVGGALWAAPAIASLPSGAAFGQTGSPQPCPGGCTMDAFAVEDNVLNTGRYPGGPGDCNNGFPTGDDCTIGGVTVGGPSDPDIHLTATVACACVGQVDNTCSARAETTGVILRLGDPLNPDLDVTADVLASQTSQSCPECTESRSSTITTLAVNGTLVDTSGIQPNSVIVVNGLTLVINEQGCTPDGDPYTIALAIYETGNEFTYGAWLLAFGYTEAGADGCGCTAPGAGQALTL